MRHPKVDVRRAYALADGTRQILDLPEVEAPVVRDEPRREVRSPEALARRRYVTVRR